MTIWAAIFLGLLQGITEFLPVSSSGHLVLAQRILGISGGTVLFDVIVHLGTLAALCVCFYKDIWALVKHPLCKEMEMLLAATVPAVIAALAFGNFIESSFGGGYLGWGFLVTAVMLLVVSSFRRNKLQITNYKLITKLQITNYKLQIKKIKTTTFNFQLSTLNSTQRR